MAKRNTKNEIRADKARAACRVATDNDTPETDIIDLLTNLMHYAKEEMVSFDQLVKIARGHFLEEVAHG